MKKNEWADCAPFKIYVDEDNLVVDDKSLAAAVYHGCIAIKKQHCFRLGDNEGMVIDSENVEWQNDPDVTYIYSHREEIDD